MEERLFVVRKMEEEDECQCGHGYCSIHGTWHLSDEAEAADPRMPLSTCQGTGGGRRIQHKPLPGGNY